MIRTGEIVDLDNGIRLHLAATGDASGRPILFLHGFPEYWAAWEDVLPYFSSGWHAVAPDLRGFNLSSQPTEVRLIAHAIWLTISNASAIGSAGRV